MSENESDDDVRTDGSGSGIVAPDDETPSWSERKQRKQGLSRLTYEYFERGRREDQDLRQQSDYVERDVLAFPAWPHEMMRNLALTSFFVGMILFVSAALPPEMPNPANSGVTPAIILPDWYLYWSFGLLKLGPLNPDLAILGGSKIMADRTYGVLLQPDHRRALDQEPHPDGLPSPLRPDVPGPHRQRDYHLRGAEDDA